MRRRLRELCGLFLIGDGLTLLFVPRRHLGLWAKGPRPYRNLVSGFARRPALSRVLGAVEAFMGWRLARRQLG